MSGLMARPEAEVVAARALGWLAATDDLLMTFLGTSGADLDDVKLKAGDPAFLAAVLDFILMDDNWAIGFCGACGLPPETPMRARAALPGGETVHWT